MTKVPAKPPAAQNGELKEALLALRPQLKHTIFFSVFTTLLSLAPTIYMLEVYDRVVNSTSMTTLTMETIAVVGFLLMFQLLEWVRNSIMQHAALQFDQRTSQRTFNALFEAHLKRLAGATGQVLNDLRTLRNFIASPALLAIIDVPLAMIYMLAIFMINTTMGWFAVVGGLLQITLTWFNQRSSQPPLTEANRAAIDAQNYVSSTLRNAQVIAAMGMQKNVQSRWLKKQEHFLIKQAAASDTAGSFSTAARFVQQTQSSILLGLGAWLLLEDKFPGGAGMMIVGSIFGGKALAPLVQLIGQWKTVVGAREAYQRLDGLLNLIPAKEPGMPLPPPQGNLSVENLIAGAPGSAAAILRGVSFALPAGKVLAVVGPSASGKTTLARLLMGIWPANSGKVRLDGADIQPWNKSELGPHVGYLPQDVELFEGTIAENIARFGEVDMDRVEAAAKAVGLHDVLLAMPDGYDSNIGEEGCFLSGGQRQRVGLARAIYGQPRFVVLDEPNSSLDEAGERDLLQTLQLLKSQGTTVVVITHRTSLLAAVDLMLILQDGQVKAYGPRDEVLAALQGKAQPAQAGRSAASPSATSAPAAAPAAPAVVLTRPVAS